MTVAEASGPKMSCAREKSQFEWSMPTVLSKTECMCYDSAPAGRKVTMGGKGCAVLQEAECKLKAASS